MKNSLSPAICGGPLPTFMGNRGGPHRRGSRGGHYISTHTLPTFLLRSGQGDSACESQAVVASSGTGATGSTSRGEVGGTPR